MGDRRQEGRTKAFAFKFRCVIEAFARQTRPVDSDRGLVEDCRQRALLVDFKRLVRLIEAADADDAVWARQRTEVKRAVR
ncbi:hypothetical protein D9M70_538750 [compost metagenome]